MKWTGHIYDLTNFEYRAHSTMAGNGNSGNLLKLHAGKIRDKASDEYFWRILVIWNHCEGVAGDELA